MAHFWVIPLIKFGKRPGSEVNNTYFNLKFNPTSTQHLGQHGSDAISNRQAEEIVPRNQERQAIKGKSKKAGQPKGGMSSYWVLIADGRPDTWAKTSLQGMQSCDRIHRQVHPPQTQREGKAQA